MRREWRISAAIFFVALVTAHASEPPPLSMMALPKIELRKPTDSAGTAAENQKESASSVAVVGEKEELTLSSGNAGQDSDAGVQVFESMNGAPLLTRIERRDAPSGAIGWLETQVWDPVFAPEVVKIGKVKMSGGIVAAIKRKNPFCLLHPLAFVASW